ncbi:MAG TPA: cellulose-binding protein [Polyangia bacterium]|nr:cellulose-binding protein [Polyangia bacterium]
MGWKNLYTGALVLAGGVTALGCGEVPDSNDLAPATVALESFGGSAAADTVARVGGGTPASATIDTRSCGTRFSPLAVGLNSAAWDGHLLDAEMPGLLERTGAQTLRYPGGSTSDNYHWTSNAPDDPAQGGTVPESTFDAFMSVVEATGAQAMITVNYGSGTAQEAADWVAYANRGGRHYRGPVPTYPGASPKGHAYGIRYWEVGNELYGDGTYGATWEVNHQSHDPTTYAQGVVRYSAAMKAVDPSIRVGAVLTAPGNWPDGQTSATSPQPWNDTVLPIACGAVDFVVVHWYPQGPTGESDAALLMSPEQGEATPVSYTPSIPSMVASLKALLASYCGNHAGAVQIMVTETNSVSYNPGKQTTSLVDALYLADAMMTWFENGVANVDWWAIHNSPFDGNADPALYGDYAYGDYGILSAGMTSAGGAVEPAANTPFPAYFGVQMLGHLGHRPQDAMLETTSSNPLVAVHAVRRGDGTIAVMLVNKDPGARYTVNVSLADATAHGWADVYRYGQGSTSIARSRARVHGASFTVTVEPYSLTTVHLP